ncbi:MAG: hypothetical protein ACKN9W_14795 [Methylococcus sp.]
MSFKAPTEAQLRYAKKLGISIPTGATKWLVSDMIDIHLGCDRWAPQWLIGYASQMQVKYFDPEEMISEKRLMRLIFSHLSGDTVAAWFAFWVFRDIAASQRIESEDPNAAVFRDIGRTLAEQQRIMTSIQGYSGHSLLRFGTWEVPDGCNMEQGGSRRTIAYKEAARLLAERMNLPERPDPAVSREYGWRASIQNDSKNNNGCLTVLALLVVLVPSTVSAVLILSSVT